jgi:hypothetical protein
VLPGSAARVTSVANYVGFYDRSRMDGLYNERTPKHTLKGAIGITIVKNKQKINN